MMNEKLIAILAELRHYLEVLYSERLVHIVLFGSQARGDAKPDSDIDVLIVLKAPVNSSAEIERTSNFTSNLCLKHNVVISRTFISAEQFQYEEGGFFRNVRREGIAV
jgi:predicted nucleotidyltransferase